MTSPIGSSFVFPLYRGSLSILSTKEATKLNARVVGTARACITSDARYSRNDDL